MNKQDYLRMEVRKLKWQKNISYKTIAEDLLNMRYHSFINWLHEYKELSNKRVDILKDFINAIKEE